MRLLKPREIKKEMNVVADLEHLRKLFIMPDSPDKFLQFGHELLDLIHNFFKEKGGIHSEIALPELAKLFSNIDIPDQPHLWKDILQEIKNNIIAHSVKVGSPYYVGHMTSAIPYFMILLEMIIAALNQNQVKIETAKASTFLEREFVSWIHRLVFNRSERFYRQNIQNPRIAIGNVTTDGTISNLTALMVARNRAFPADGRFPGIRKAGLFEAYRYYNCEKAVLIVSKRGHYSIDKVARILGIGENNVIKIPVDAHNKIDIEKLRQTCNDIREHNRNNAQKIKIISLIGIAGTTETGNIDNLLELKQVADEHDAYFHVDAAWGGSLLMVEKYRHLFKGIECADSVSFDAHKLLYSPLSMGVVIFRKETDCYYLKHTSNYIIRQDSIDQGRFTVEGSRPFSCLKPWVTVKMFGTEGFKVLFDHAFDLTYVLRGLVEAHNNFEQMNYPEIFIFNYRFVPKKVREKLDALMRDRDNTNEKKRNAAEIRIKRINHALNQLNIELHRAIRQEDNSFVSRTILESTRYAPQNIVVLRSLTINPLTTPDILREIIDEQNRLGMKIYKNEFEKQLENL